MEKNEKKTPEEIFVIINPEILQWNYICNIMHNIKNMWKLG